MIQIQQKPYLAEVECVLITLRSQQMKNVPTFKKVAEPMVKVVLKIQKHALNIKELKLSAINLQVSFQIAPIDNGATTQLELQLLPIA